MKIILYYAGILLGILILSGFTSQNARGEGSEKPPQPVKKLALLIANQNYPQREEVKGRLNTPIKDVRGIANALEEAGFTSFVYENLSSKADLEGAVNYLFQQLKEDDTAWLMFYYAGHATEANGQNYLIPTGVGKLRNQEELKDQAMSVQTGVMEKMRRQGKINIVVLDACRSHSGKTSENKAADDFEGGDVLDSVGGENVFVVYSTASDETALDGKRGEYSPFAESLIKGIQQLHWYPLGMMLWWVGEQVQTKTSQQPYLYIPAGKNICLSKCSKPEPIIITP